MVLQLRYVTHSEIGLIRKNNQDSGYASPHLLVVADGMGGAAAGDLASAVAIDSMRRIEGPTEGEQMLEVLAGAIHRANDRIADLVEADLTLDGMGTTVTSAMFDGVELGLAHIGDSRAYLLRGGRLERLTHDHSWVQSLVDEGKISADEASIHPHRSLLLKVLNGQPASDPDLEMVPVEAGDRLMFCSDGVCGLIDDAEIEAALLLPERRDALDRLVSAALSEGGVDNITAIVADVVEAGEPGATGPGETEPPVVIGAAAERRIPPIQTRARDGGSDEEDQDDEDTVISLGTKVAAAPAAVLVDEERYTPQAPSKRRFVRPLIGLLALLLIATAGLGTAYAWTRTQYYVGADGEHVAIFQGLSDSFPGVRLSQVYEVQPLTVAELPAYYQEKVRANIDVATLESARQTVAELTAAAKRCAEQQTPTPKPTGKPTGPTPTDTGSPAPSTPAATTSPQPNC